MVEAATLSRCRVARLSEFAAKIRSVAYCNGMPQFFAFR